MKNCAAVYALSLLVVVALTRFSAVHGGFFHHALQHLGHEVDKHVVKEVSKGVKNIVNDVLPTESLLSEVDVHGLSWTNCGSGSDVVKVNSLSVGPDPVHLPGTVNVGFDVTVATNITGQIVVDLKIKTKQKIFGWIDVPCVDHKGSCTYDMQCPTSPSKHCPAVVQQHGLPCECPVKEGHYVLPVSGIPVSDIKIPSLFKHGEYKVRARASMAGRQLLCADVSFSLK